MMKSTFWLLGIMLCACSNSGTPAASADTTVGAGGSVPSWDSASLATLPACFAYQTSNDLVSLKLTTITPAVSGDLEYAFMGKDKNAGTIRGEMRGDTLLADYTFQSEGKTSVRQVAFLLRRDGFVEGYGDAEQQGDKMVFKNRDALNFGGTMVLKKLPCP